MKWIFVFLVGWVMGEMCSTVTSNKEVSDTQEKFVPTSEWQEVKKGQPLPAGLHYRLNINTGLTEVKLLEPKASSKHEDSNTGLVALPRQDEEESYVSKEELEQILSKVTADIDSENHDFSNIEGSKEIKTNFRSYDELKREFGSLNLTVKTDMEILTELVDRAKKYRTGNKNEEEELVLILKDLEYLVHQIDNAIEFIRLGGITHIIEPTLNSTSPMIRAESLWLLGSAAQSNPKVQIAFLNAGIISKLVKVVVLDSDSTVHSRGLYALSCLTRQFPAAQARLIEEGGLASLSIIMDNKRTTDFKTKMRVVTLVNDLITERVNIRKALKDNEAVDGSKESDTVHKTLQHKHGELKEKARQYDATNLEKHLVEDSWCKRISEFLCLLYEGEASSGRAERRDDLGSVMSKDVPYRPEHDDIEKVIGTLSVMRDLCLNEFQQDTKLEVALKNFYTFYEDLSIREELVKNQAQKTACKSADSCSSVNEFGFSINESDMYYTSISEKFRNLLFFLRKLHVKANDMKDEL